MKLTKEQTDTLIQMIASTKSEELDCNGCLDQLAEYVEVTLAGKSIAASLILVEQHLKNCGECREEFEALKFALENEVS